ncbi:hypothetical protein SAMN05216409_1281, partial [Pseudomonas lutea]
GLDMQQVWAQVFEQYYQAGEQWHLTEWEEELLAQSNDRFREVSPIEELIPKRFDLKTDPRQWITAAEVLLLLGYDKPSRAQQIETGHALRNLNIPSRIKQGRSLYHLPHAKIGN